MEYLKSDAEIFRDNVKDICISYGVSMGDISEEAGYTRTHLSILAYRNNTVSIDHIRSYARALGVKPGRLIEGMFDEEDAQIFRQNIRTLCEEQGITLAEVMEKAGYNVNHLHHLACKHLPPTEEAVRCYAKALGVEPERLKEGFDDY